MRINCILSGFLSPKGSCQFIKCSNNKSCIEDQSSTPQCVTCPRCSGSNKNLTHSVSKMVCGADGVTYRSLCELRQKSCKLGKSIALLHRGPCTGKKKFNFFAAWVNYVHDDKRIFGQLIKPSMLTGQQTIRIQNLCAQKSHLNIDIKWVISI